MEFEHVFVFGKCVPTEVLHLSGPKGVRQREWHSFFIPGNPGSLFYYLPWLQEVQAMQQVEVDKIYGEGAVSVLLHGLSHANHHFSTHEDKDSDHLFEEYGLDFQIEHATSFVRQVLTGNRSVSAREKSPLISFIGHSIGAYFVLDLLDRHPDIAKMTVSASLLMPFISWSSLDFVHKVKLTAFLNTPESLIDWLASKLDGMVHSIPLQRRISWLATLQGDAMDADCAAVTASRLFSKRMLANFASMGRDEIEQIPLNEHRMLGIITRLSATLRLQALYTDADVWAPARDAETIRFHAPYVQTVHISNLQHAFCMVRKKQGVITEALRSFLHQVLLSPIGITRTHSKL